MTEDLTALQKSVSALFNARLDNMEMACFPWSGRALRIWLEDWEAWQVGVTC